MTTFQKLYAITKTVKSDLNTLTTFDTLLPTAAAARRGALHKAQQWLCQRIRNDIDIQNEGVRISIDLTHLPVIPFESLNMHQKHHVWRKSPSESPLQTQNHNDKCATLTHYSVRQYALLYGDADKSSVNVIHIDKQPVSFFKGGGYQHTFEVLTSFMVQSLRMVPTTTTTTTTCTNEDSEKTCNEDSHKLSSSIGVTDTTGGTTSDQPAMPKAPPAPSVDIICGSPDNTKDETWLPPQVEKSAKKKVTDFDVYHSWAYKQSEILQQLKAKLKERFAASQDSLRKSRLQF